MHTGACHALTAAASLREPRPHGRHRAARGGEGALHATLVCIPEASHGMEGRPCRLAGKIVHILKWFETH
jgi:hypothetical protein